MADTATLSLTIAGVTSTQLDVLVKNIGAEALSKALMIEIKIPLYLVSKEISDAVERARQRNINERTTASKESLANVVTATAGWSVWATTERTDSLAVIRLFNDLTQSKLTPAAAFDAGAQFNLRLPLTPQDKPSRVEIPYSYRYPHEGRSGIQTDGKLEMTTSGATTRTKVIFKVDSQTPTVIPPGHKIHLEWEIENGVSATLYGPLPSGNSQMSLSSDESATYKIRKGSLEIFAVGSATYFLQAEVRGNPNEIVVRTLQIDITSADQYSYLGVRPPRVMPHGLLEVDWAVWGIEKTWLSVGNDYEIELKLTEQGASQTYQGSGIWRVVAPQAEGTVTALLEIQLNNQRKEAKTQNFIVAAWRPKEVSFSGKPIGLAVAAPRMALLTSEALLLAEVGASDPPPDSLDFKPVPLADAKARLALAAFDDGFVVLQQTSSDGLQLVRYSPNGQRNGLPVDLPDTVKPLVRELTRFFDLTVLGERVYVAVQAAGPNGYRRAFSVRFKPQVQLQPEPLLESMRGYRLVTFDNALYAVHHGWGRMFRFRQDRNGQLDLPVEAARAVKDGQSMIQQGVLVPVGRVLVVLGPSSIPPIDALESIGFLKYILTKSPAFTTQQMTQDLVYNPQQNHWMPCGRGLALQPNAVAAFRPGASKRLWVVQPDRKAHTLSGAVEHLFSPEFVADFPTKDLPPYFVKREYTIKNETGIDFVPMDEVYRKAGLDDFSPRGPAKLVEMPDWVPNRATGTFEFRCNEADPAPMKLRMMANVRKGGLANRYIVEIDFSGTGHSVITSVIKRVAIDEQGKVSVAEVPGTSARHAAGAAIVLPFAQLLVEGVKLNLVSLSSYLFGLRRYLEPLTGENSNEYKPDRPIKIAHDTAAFSIFVTGAGELRFDVDFAMPHGIEISQRSAKQTKLIRIDPEKAGVLSIDSTSYKEPNLYECAIRYRQKKDLDGIYMGDCVRSRDGNSLYLTTMSPRNLSQVELLRIDAASFVPLASNAFQGPFSIFSVPNSVGVLSDRIVASFGSNTLFVMDHSLQTKQTFTLSGMTAIVAMAAAEFKVGVSTVHDMIGLLCMKEERVGQDTRYSYSYVWKKLVQDKLIDVGSYSLDPFQQISTRNRVPRAPAWISSNSIPVMVLRPDGNGAAICVEGGIIVLDTERDVRVRLQPIAGTGRAEAVMFERTGDIYCAHSDLNNQALLVSYVDGLNLQIKKTISLPGAVSNMITDTKPLPSPALQYKQHRAVSFFDGAVGAICVSHGKTIYAITKNGLSIQSSVTVDLPCSLIQAKTDRAPHREHDFSGAAPCWIVSAIGAAYNGDGRNAGNFKTQLYRVGFE
jgi:hypothetical protein